ncbi:MAG: Ger(x)C family spore germination protein [Bacillota bacterium]
MLAPKSRYLACLLLVLLLLPLLGGCWNRRELIDLAVVVGIGLDLADEPGQVLVTAQIVKPAEVYAPGEGAGGAQGPAVWVVSSAGETVFQAVRSLASVSDRELLFSHNQIIVIGRVAAEQGIRPLLDFFLRNYETRRSVWVLVAEGQACDVLEAESELNPIPAIAIMQLVKLQATRSTVAQVTMQDLVARLVSPTAAPVASLVTVFTEGAQKRVCLSGTSVFRDDRLVGRLDETASRGLLWVLGEVRSGIIVISGPGGGKVALEIIGAKSRVIPHLDGGRLTMRLDVAAEGDLGDQMVPKDLSKPEQLALLEKGMAEAIRREIEAALVRARQLGTDIFDFGTAVGRRYPEAWKNWEKRWPELFPSLPVEITVKTRLRQVGLITKPIIPQ